MNTEHLAERTKKRLDEIDRGMALIDLCESEIAKTFFHTRARKFIESLMRQREVIIQRNKSIKNPCRMLRVIDHLRINLEATGRKDRALARFFLDNEDDIRQLIPGSYPSKRYDDFINLRDEAREIKNREISVS